MLRVPASRDGLGPFYRDVIAVDPLEPWTGASAAYRLRILESTLPFPVAGARLVPSEALLHGDFYLGNVLVHHGQVSALIDFEFARLGPPDLELISVIRALDMETRAGVPRPPLLTWLAEDYPGLFAAPGLDKRLWAYAIAYTIRHIVFWPPDRPETEGLDPAHPLHTLRRLIDAPLPRTFPGRPQGDSR